MPSRWFIAGGNLVQVLKSERYAKLEYYVRKAYILRSDDLQSEEKRDQSSIEQAQPPLQYTLQVDLSE